MGSHASQINYAERWQVIKWVEKLRADGLGVSLGADSTAKAASDTTKVAAAGVKTAMK
jgi:hypothetical protein